MEVREPDFSIEMDTSEGTKRIALYRDGDGNVAMTLLYMDAHSQLRFEHTFSAEKWIQLVAAVSKTSGDPFAQSDARDLHLWKKKEA